MHTTTTLQYHQHTTTPSIISKPTTASTSDEEPGDIDDIDDILRSLWPTSTAISPSTTATPPLSSRSLDDGVLPPPQSPCVNNNMMFQTPKHSTKPNSVTSIQIGDPEWRVDSPQSIHASSVASPTKEGVAANIVATPSPIARKKRALGLGLGGTGAGGRSVSYCPPPLRILTEEERAARLNTVSGLAARAVARRCLSGQVLQPSLGEAKKKLTFADVAKHHPGNN